MTIFNKKSLRFMAKGEAGANMVEFAIAFPVFMMFVVVIIDLGRVSSLSSVIRESMATGIKTATSVANLDVDPRGVPKADYGYMRSKIARKLVEDSALKLVAGLGGVSTESDAAIAAADTPKFYDIVITENRITDGPDATTYKIAVLLPGECATVPALGITECNRETLGTSNTDPFPAQPAEFLIKKHPVKLLAFAHFNSFTPWLFNNYHKFEQFGFRQPIPQGPFPTKIDPQPYSELKAAMEPGDTRPKGNAQLPGEDPKQCVPDWTFCIKQSIAATTSQYKKQVPTYWLPSPSGDGICGCSPASERP